PTPVFFRSRQDGYCSAPLPAILCRWASVPGPLLWLPVPPVTSSPCGLAASTPSPLSLLSNLAVSWLSGATGYAVRDLRPRRPPERVDVSVSPRLKPASSTQLLRAA